LLKLIILHLHFSALIKNSRVTDHDGRTDGRDEHFEAFELTRFVRVRKTKRCRKNRPVSFADCNYPHVPTSGIFM